MHTIRPQLARTCRISKQPIAQFVCQQPTRDMSLFPRFVSHNQEFTPLFRLLDDFATISRSGLAPTPSVRSFTPKFDVRELKDSYELHGELPGIEQKDLDIQWSDSQTLAIKGRVETRSEQGQRPTDAVAATTTTTEEPTAQTPTSESSYHKPTVEEEFVEVSEHGETPAASEPEQTQAVTKSTTDTPAPVRYWVSERSVGEFARSFSFPTRVDQDAVKASLKNGILSVVVPKAQAPQPRRILVE